MPTALHHEHARVNNNQTTEQGHARVYRTKASSAVLINSSVFHVFTRSKVVRTRRFVSTLGSSWVVPKSRFQTTTRSVIPPHDRRIKLFPFFLKAYRESRDKAPFILNFGSMWR
jgi:hypothetical protein